MEGDVNKPSCCSTIDIKKILEWIGLGQILSLLICGTAVTCGVLQQHNINIPTAQSFLNYVLLAVVYTLYYMWREGSGKWAETLRQRGWVYAAIALVDVEANYLVVKSYHYTTVTSVQLLDSFTIPTVMVLSRLMFSLRYRWLHFVGVVICMIGTCSLVLSDYIIDQHPSQGSNRLLGDVLCVIGAILYGVSNVAQEFIVRRHSNSEFLAFVGLAASFISGVQLLILERREVVEADFNSWVVGLSFGGFVICLFSLYSLMPVVIKRTNAMSVNLNLLSSDFYALLVGLFLFKYTFYFLYFISFVLIIVGIFLYTLRPPLSPPLSTDPPTTTSSSTDETTPVLPHTVHQTPALNHTGSTSPTTSLDHTDSTDIPHSIRVENNS